MKLITYGGWWALYTSSFKEEQEQAPLRSYARVLHDGVSSSDEGEDGTHEGRTWHNSNTKVNFSLVDNWLLQLLVWLSH